MKFKGANIVLPIAASLILAAHFLGGTKSIKETAPPAEIAAIFEAQPDKMLIMEAFDPGSEYAFETSEKDARYGQDEKYLRFRRVEMTLKKKTPPGTCLVDIAFMDGLDNRVDIPAVDLLRLVPKLDATDAMQLPEFLLAEYNRFGVTFRREHKEFDLKITNRDLGSGKDNVYRLGLWNNCLNPTKWEMTLDAEEYGDFKRRQSSSLNLNQDRTLSHVWFYVDQNLYHALLRIKNPNLSFDPSMDYETLLKEAEKVRVDLEGLRKVKSPIPIKVLEIGHQSRRPIVPIDKETHYKRKFGLALNREEFLTYDDILEQPIKLARFAGRGFYQTKSPKVMDYGWMRSLDDIAVDTLDVPGAQTYVQITIHGKDAPYQLVMGNIDLALLDEQRLYGMLFGINTYPKARRHNPHPDTIQYEPDRMPENIKPYLMLVDSKTGAWGNNHEKGIEKVFLAWETIDRDVLEIYILSYERILPVWVARIRLDDKTVNLVRKRRSLYTY